MKHTWNKEYYDMINFYYWEPQHLGKKKNPDSKYHSLSAVLSHISNMEVSLNHQFNLFFQLLPNSVLSSIINTIVHSYQKDDTLTFQSIELLNRLNLNDATQPDIFFKGKDSLIGIEFKLGAKSSIDQLLKYAMLFYFSQKHSGRTKACHLIYIGPTEFNDLFKGKNTKIHDLQQGLTADDLSDKTKKGGMNLIPHKENILNVAKNMTINFINYQSLHDLFHCERNQIDSSTAYAETVAKLFDGINDELLMRGLAKA